MPGEVSRVANIQRRGEGEKKGGRGKLTAVDRLGRLLRLGAGAVDLGLLRVQAGARAVAVKVAVVVHGPLQAVVLPTEQVVAVRRRAAMLPSSAIFRFSFLFYLLSPFPV